MTEEQKRAAAPIFSNHPYLSLADGSSIEVVECPPIPDSSRPTSHESGS